MAKHKKRTWVKPDEAQEVYKLLETKSVLAVTRATGISRSKVYELKKSPLPKRANELGRDERTIRRWDGEDKDGDCVQHVLTRETTRKEYPITGGTTVEMIEIRRCRHCPHEEERRRFVHIYG